MTEIKPIISGSIIRQIYKGEKIGNQFSDEFFILYDQLKDKYEDNFWVIDDNGSDELIVDVLKVET